MHVFLEALFSSVFWVAFLSGFESLYTKGKNARFYSKRIAGVMAVFQVFLLADAHPPGRQAGAWGGREFFGRKRVSTAY